MVNESLVKELGLKEPLGTKITADWDNSLKLQIVGVYEDFHYESLHRTIQPAMLYMRPSIHYSEIWVRVRPESAGSTLKYLEKVWRKFEPFRPFDADFIEILNRKQYEQEARWQQITQPQARLRFMP